jgi:hypothetical protein
LAKSNLECNETQAIFRGNLDIKALGGAGFASQRTATDDYKWDLSSYDGIQISVDTKQSDNKKYTFIIKDTLLPPDSKTGREQSTVSWEYDFVVARTSGNSGTNFVDIWVPWDAFTPTYRGKECSDVPQLKRASIKRYSIMMRRSAENESGAND